MSAMEESAFDRTLDGAAKAWNSTLADPETLEAPASDEWWLGLEESESAGPPLQAPPPPASPAAPEDPAVAQREKAWYFGNYHLAKGEPAKAEQQFRRLVELAPGDVPAWLMVGEACARQGRYDQAREAWERVLRLDPGNPEADAYIRRLVRGDYRPRPEEP